MLFRIKVLLVFLILFSSSYAFSLNEFTAKIDVDRANRLLRKGDYDNAISLYEKALSKLPTSPEIYYNMGTTLSSMGDMESAVQAFDMAKKNFTEKTSKDIKMERCMNFKISKMMAKKDFQKEFSDFMLKAVSIPNVISFAGGMPNPISFPNKELKKAYSFVMDNHYKTALQYANTQGYIELRKIIAQRYKTKENINVEADDILIINGAQQGFDIISAVTLNDNDNVIVEAPTFLAAIQTFNLYNAKIHSVEINDKGINLDELKNILKKYKSKLFYTIPNFQNPTGLTYNNETRKIIADMIKKTNTILIEDNPYGALRFKGENQESFFNLLNEQVILMGSFSKTISPGIRVGWIASKNKEFIKKIN